MSSKKELCNCGKMAVYLYMPSSDRENPYYCNECVTSPSNKVGCSCNWFSLQDEAPVGIEGKDWIWVEQEGDEHTERITKADGEFIYLNELGRPYPCVEYMYDADGYDVDTFWSKLRYSIIFGWWKFKLKVSKFFRVWPFN